MPLSRWRRACQAIKSCNFLNRVQLSVARRLVRLCLFLSFECLHHRFTLWQSSKRYFRDVYRNAFRSYYSTDWKYCVNIRVHNLVCNVGHSSSDGRVFKSAPSYFFSLSLLYWCTYDEETKKSSSLFCTLYTRLPRPYSDSVDGFLL